MDDGLRKLLRSDDFDTVQWGLELARAKGAGDDLLAGVTLERGSPPYFPVRGELPAGQSIRVGEHWGHRKGRELVRQLAVLGLIATGEGPRAAELRDRLAMLCLGERNAVGVESIDLSLLSGLSRLERLAVRHERIRDVKALGALPLRSLWLASDKQSCSLDGLPETLEELVLDGRFVDLDAIAGLPNLKRLCIHVPGSVAWSALVPPSLEVLKVRAMDLRGAFAPGTSLRELDLEDCTGHLDTRGWSAPQLARLAVGRGRLRSFGPQRQMQVTLEGPIDLPVLDELMLVGRIEVGPLDTLPMLRSLTLVSDAPLSLTQVQPQPALRVLHLSGRPSSIGAPAHLPEVKLLKLYRGTQLDELCELPALAQLTISVLPGGDLAPIEDLELETLSLFDTFERLDRVPKVRRMGNRTLRLKGVKRIDGLHRWGGIRTLHLEKCPELESLQGLQGMAELELLTLRDCPALTDVSALDGLPALRVVATRGNGPRKTAYPKSIRSTVTTAKLPDLDKLMLRPPPCAPEPVEAQAPAAVAVAEVVLPPALAAVVDDLAADGPRRAYPPVSPAHEALLEAQLPTRTRWDQPAGYPPKGWARDHAVATAKALALGPIPEPGWTTVGFERGFPAALKMTGAEWAAGAAQWVAAFPTVTELDLRNVQALEFAAVMAAPLPHALRRLEVTGRSAGTDVAVAEWLARLALPELSFQVGQTPTFFKTFVADPKPALRRLQIGPFGGNELKVFAALEAPELRRLVLSNAIGEVTTPKFLGPLGGCPKLEWLSFGGCHLRAGGVRNFLDAGILPRLRALDLRNCHGGQGLRDLLGQLPEALRFLDVSWSKLSKPAVQALAAHGSRLRYLKLARCELSDKLAQELVHSTVLPEDLVLLVSGNPLDTSLPALRERFAHVVFDDNQRDELYRTLDGWDWLAD